MLLLSLSFYEKHKCAIFICGSYNFSLTSLTLASSTFVGSLHLVTYK